MQLQYNYKVMRVDENSKVMEILYTPQDPSHLGEYLVSARLPYVGENIETVVHMYAPIGLWHQEIYEFDTVVEGLEGSLTCAIN